MCKFNLDSDAIGAELFDGPMFGNTDSDSTEEFRNAYAEESQARTSSRARIPIDTVNSIRADGAGAIGDSDKNDQQEVSLEIEHDQTIIFTAKPSKNKSHNEKHPGERQTNGEAARLMTVKEVATYLGVSISKVWRMCKREVGFPKPVRICGSTRWDRYAIDHYLDRLQAAGHSGY